MEAVKEYISTQPQPVAILLEKIRASILKVAPSAIEGFAYKMPSYKLNGKPLVYFAAFKQHIGLYATPSAQARFSTELKAYKQGKGSVQFPLTEPIPYLLIERMVAFRAAEIMAK